MKTMHKLLLILIFIALFDFCGCTEKTAQPEPGWQVIDFVWTKENSDKDIHGFSPKDTYSF